MSPTRLTRPALFALPLLLVLAGSAVPAAPSRVARVLDGDTVVLESGERVRYLGINAPEAGQPLAAEATARNAALVRGRTVTLETDTEVRDQYGRLLAFVYVGGTSVSATLIQEGLAHVLLIPPNGKHAEDLLALQQEAQAARRGIWGPAGIRGPFKIVTVRANPPGDEREDPNGEYVRIACVAAEPASLAGYTLPDRYGHRYRFPPLTLHPGYTALVFSGEGTDQLEAAGQARLYWRAGGPVWNNAGDEATLRDPAGTVVDRVLVSPRRSRRGIPGTAGRSPS
ncbi:MAG: thermonuclease family protein [Candidatus Methylomirabilales bacterium]